MKRALLVAVSLGLAVVALVAGTTVTEEAAGSRSDGGSERVSPAPSAAEVLTPAPAAPTPRSFAPLENQVTHLLDSAGVVAGGVSFTELASGQSWALNGDESFVAASAYKLPLLMLDAQDVASGNASPTDELCYDASDWEDGYFGDYEEGACYTRAELDRRAGIYSDNTAAHMLVRYDGGADRLNAYARALGATESAFYDPNTTTSSDLARLWQAEAGGKAGGSHAQAYLYPLLTNTVYEDGIPAGVGAGITVVHKVGILDDVLNDAALVEAGPRGAYVLAVCTEGGSWQLIARVASAVAQFEAS